MAIDEPLNETNYQELLKIAAKNGMIDLPNIQEAIEMAQRQEILAMHPYQIWRGKNGKYYTYMPDDEKGRVLKKRNSKRDIENVVIEYWEPRMNNPTVEEVFNEWNDRRLELKKISEATHLRNRQFFKRHYEEMGQRPIKDVTMTEWNDFLEEQIPKFNLTAKAFSGLKGITKGLLKRARKRGLINFRVEDLFADMDISDVDFKKDIKEDYQEVFSEDETPVIMNYLAKNCDVYNALLLLIFVSGIRCGEAVSLKHSDIGLNSINIRRTETRFKDKNGRYQYKVKDFPKTGAGVRTVVIPNEYAWLLQKIQAFSRNDEFVFVKDGKRVHTLGVWRRLDRVCKKLGIYHKSPHKIRKTYGTILLDNGIDNRLIIDQMGHTDIACTEGYYHRNRRSIEKKGEIISALPDFTEVITGNQK